MSDTRRLSLNERRAARAALQDVLEVEIGDRTYRLPSAPPISLIELAGALSGGGDEQVDPGALGRAFDDLFGRGWRDDPNLSGFDLADLTDLMEWIGPIYMGGAGLDPSPASPPQTVS